MFHGSYKLSLGFIKYLQPLTITSKFYTQNNNLMLTQETISYCYYDHWHHKKNQDKTVHFHGMNFANCIPVIPSRVHRKFKNWVVNPPIGDSEFTLTLIYTHFSHTYIYATSTLKFKTEVIDQCL